MYNKAVIFDMDGVIFDTESVWKHSFHYTSKVFTIKTTEKYRQQFSGMKEKNVKHILQNDFPKLDAEKFFKYMANLVDHTITNDGVPLKNLGFKNLVNNLKNNGYKIALATAATKERTNKLFKKVGLNLSEIFDKVICADDVKIGKPDPTIYLVACKKLGLEPKECFAIEDSSNGIKSAFAAGCHPIMVIDLTKPNSDTKAMCEKVFKKLDQAVDYIIKEKEK